MPLVQIDPQYLCPISKKVMEAMSEKSRWI